ncbi:MAG: SCP2 sterol-binding domain-containing protein [Candidatus Methanomethylophilaceae archaeon]|nr:SCP2 sterol-binding domain-containing protein [Candidatus Methanomethylophilaceae archaeon]
MTMEPKLQLMIDKFHRRMEKDPEAKAKVEPVTKTINIDLGEEHYSLRLEKAQIHDFKPELLENADILLKTTSETLDALIEGTLRPMRAYMLKKITIKGKIEDILHLKSLFSSDKKES